MQLNDNQQQIVQSNSTVFAGPFMGEFGWELSHWMPHVRWLRNQYKGKKLVVSSYPGRHPLYYGIADEFIPLPDWFVSQKYDCDCFEALSDDGHYQKLIQHFKEHFKNQPNLLWTKTPRGMNKLLRENNHVIFDYLHQSDKADSTANDLIEKHGGKPVIVVFARSMSNRKMFLDVIYNKYAHVEDWYSEGLPERNWPRSYWQDLMSMLYQKYADQFTFAIGGTKTGNCLLDEAQRNADIIDLTEFDVSKSLDVTIALLNKALLSISSQSGPTHLSVQCGCPSFIYGHEMQRHTVDDNPLQTDVCFYPTELMAYNDPPKNLFKEISTYIHQLCVEKHIPIGMGQERLIAPVQKGKIRTIGIVGVFENPDSTNIPFAKAFLKRNIYVETFEYRSVAAEIGIDAMNIEIEKFATKFDLIIICKGNGIRAETIRRMSQVTSICFYMMDAKTHLDHDPAYYKMAANSTFSIVTTESVKCALLGSGAKNIHHILQGIDPDQFRPILSSDNKKDAVFIGQWSDKRQSIIEGLKRNGIEVSTFGLGFGKECYGHDFNKACVSHKILLAINNTDSDQDSFSDRIMRYLATKGCVVTEYSKGLEKYFQNGVHLAWPEGEQTLAETIRFYLDHPKAADQMAERGHQYVLANHTWDNVAEKIISITEGN